MERDFQLILSSCPGGPGGSRTRYPPRRMHQIHLAGPWDAADDLLRRNPKQDLMKRIVGAKVSVLRSNFQIKTA